jgi:hydrogenase nickel incorporation protein HypB
VKIEESVLDRNQEYADRIRTCFFNRGLRSINVMSSPGSGKTALLERLLETYKGNYKVAIIVGDLATDNDARRLSGRGAEVVQITTGGYCHLDAKMIEQTLEGFDLDELDLLVIENVGNLVCPAAFDLGEDVRVALLSVTEGEDKPLKYPSLFSRADVVVINKIDIAEVVEWDRAAAMDALHQVAPTALIFELSAKTGEGVREFCEWIALHLQCELHGD